MHRLASPLAARRFQSTTLLVLTNMQREHVVPGRRFVVANQEQVRTSCRALLDRAREEGLPVAHFRRIGRDLFFNPADRFSSWVEEFVPRPSEMVFEHEAPSCFSCDAFARLLSYMHEPRILLAGLGAEYTSLGTASEAFGLGHTVSFVPEGSGASTVRDDALHSIMAQFATPIDLSGALRVLSSPNEARIA